MLASKDLTMQRLSVCSTCDSKVVTLNFIRCSECGCVLKLKAKLVDATCPLGKWETPIKQEK